jgi:hypothetical protein
MAAIIARRAIASKCNQLDLPIFRSLPVFLSNELDCAARMGLSRRLAQVKRGFAQVNPLPASRRVGALLHLNAPAAHPLDY